MTANHEVGTRAAGGRGGRGLPGPASRCYVDAAQSVGRLPVPRRLVAAVGQRAQVGRAARGRLLVVRKGTRWRSRRCRPTSASAAAYPAS